MQTVRYVRYIGIVLPLVYVGLKKFVWSTVTEGFINTFLRIFKDKVN